MNGPSSWDDDDRPSRYIGLDEPVLLQLIEVGDPVAAFELVRRYRKRLIVPTAYGVVRDRADAEEACQELLLRLLKLQSRCAGESGWPPRSVPGWMATVVRRLATDLKRGREAERKRRAYQWAWISKTPTPEEELVLRQRRRRIRRALSRLPPEERQAVELLDLEDLPVALACEKAGTCRATLYRRRERALDRLRRDHELQQLSADAWGGPGCEVGAGETFSSLAPSPCTRKGQSGGIRESAGSEGTPWTGVDPIARTPSREGPAICGIGRVGLHR